jgi:hypothetical protein
MISAIDALHAAPSTRRSQVTKLSDAALADRLSLCKVRDIMDEIDAVARRRAGQL